MERRAFLADMQRAFISVKLAEAEVWAQDYLTWRRYRTAAQNDAALARWNDAREAYRLIVATADTTVH